MNELTKLQEKLYIKDIHDQIDGPLTREDIAYGIMLLCNGASRNGYSLQQLVEDILNDKVEIPHV